MGPELKKRKTSQKAMTYWLVNGVTFLLDDRAKQQEVTDSVKHVDLSPSAPKFSSFRCSALFPSVNLESFECVGETK